MALKDWEKIKDTGIRQAFKKGKTNTLLLIDKTLSGDFIILVGKSENPNQPFLSFMANKNLGIRKTKSGALKYARAYMRKN